MIKWWFLGPGVVWEKMEVLVKRYKTSFLKEISTENILYSMVTTVNNHILYTWNLLSVDHKCSHHTHKITMWVDWYVNYLDCGNHFTVHTSIKTLHCTP